ncbi:TPA: hypothetical protein O8T98_004455 [Enterobacter asburiae]|nr:hypothetical protein [Enterobacter asburiae]
MKKNNINLILMAGNAEINERDVFYKGYLTPPVQSTTTLLPQSVPFVPPPPVDIRTNAHIIEGELEFEFILEGDSSFFSVNLWGASDHLLIKINEFPYFCSVKRYQNNTYELVNYVGTSSAVTKNEKSALMIKINSSFITVLINEIIVLTQYFLNTGVGIGFNVYGPSPLKLLNIAVVDKKPKVFVVMQFKDSYNEIYEEVIKPICYEYGLEVTRSDDSYRNGSIIREILTELAESTLIIADITPDNPNVYYEVGYAHALKKEVVLLCNDARTNLPFDLADYRTVFYKDSIAGHSQIKIKLRKHLEEILRRDQRSQHQ